MIEEILRDIDRAERKAQAVEVDLLRPSTAILCALVSAIIHADEFMSPNGHRHDLIAFRVCLERPDLQAWIAGMVKAGFEPVKR